MLIFTLFSDMLAMQQNHAAPAMRDVAHQGNQSTSLPLISMINNMSNDTTSVITCHDTKHDRSAYLGRDGKFRPLQGSPTGAIQQINPDDISIPLGAVGSKTSIALPGYASACRAYFAQGDLWFGTVSTGPNTNDSNHIGLVQPAFTTPSDPNFNISAAFMEFAWVKNDTFTVNPSAVDFVDVPLALNLTEKYGNKMQSVGGLFADAKYGICEQLKNASSAAAPWDKSCVYDSNGNLTRVIAPIHIVGGNKGAFDDYWNPYIDQVLQRFSVDPLVVRIGDGDHACQTDSVTETLWCQGMGRIPFRPTPADIFGCNSGPFGRPNADGTEKAIMTNVCADFNRGTMLDRNSTGQAIKSKAYKHASVHNAYAKAVHDNEHDGKGYGFSYDDVDFDGEAVAGVLSVAADNVGELTIYVGGLHSPLLRGNSTTSHPGHNTTIGAYPILVDPHRSNSTKATVLVKVPTKTPRVGN